MRNTRKRLERSPRSPLSLASGEKLKLYNLFSSERYRSWQTSTGNDLNLHSIRLQNQAVDILTDNPYDGHIPHDRCETEEPVDGAEKHYGRQVVLLVLGNLSRALILIVTHP